MTLRRVSAAVIISGRSIWSFRPLRTFAIYISTIFLLSCMYILPCHPGNTFIRCFRQQQNLFSVHRFLLQSRTAHRLQISPTSTLIWAILTFYWQTNKSSSGSPEHLFRGNKRKIFPIGSNFGTHRVILRTRANLNLRWARICFTEISGTS